MRFAAEGARVACADRDGDGAQRCAAAIAAAGGAASAWALDVTDEHALAKVADELGRIDVLHANAGVAGEGRAHELDRVSWERVIGVSLTGTWLTIKAVLPAMRRAGGGSIVTTASVAAATGVPALAAYSAAKGGVVALTRQVAVDYAPEGIRANCVCPGTVDTALVRDAHRERAGGDPTAAEELLAARAATVPLGRLGTPGDVAALVAFLASEDAAWITGATYVADGGVTAAHPGHAVREGG